jgi:hypothetical protein
MKNIFYSIIVLALILLIECKENDVSLNPLIPYEGNWIVDDAILDGVVVENWESTLFEIAVSGDTTLLVKLTNRPTRWELVWPDQTSLKLLDSDKRPAVFRREDIGLIYVFRMESLLIIQLGPPRSFSYDEECVQGDSLLLCEKFGHWEIRLLRK